MRFEMNMNGQELENWIRSTPGFQQLQEDANERVRRLVREVNSALAGEPVNVIDAELRRRFGEAGIIPIEENFATIVQHISDRTLTDETTVRD
jgi:trimethylamine:corrinoid methyltransferase-like protein